MTNNAKQLTTAQVQFIHKNRLQMSMNDMAAHLELPFYHVKKYMNENGLKLTPEEVQKMRIGKMRNQNITPKRFPSSAWIWE